MPLRRSRLLFPTSVPSILRNFCPTVVVLFTLSYVRGGSFPEIFALRVYFARGYSLNTCPNQLATRISKYIPSFDLFRTFALIIIVPRIFRKDLLPITDKHSFPGVVVGRISRAYLPKFITNVLRSYFEFKHSERSIRTHFRRLQFIFPFVRRGYFDYIYLRA